jgi:Winged helix-turn-helix DNA-binding
VLFKQSQLAGIADGSIDLTFRRWDAPRVRAGSQQRTAAGVIAFDAVERVDDLTDEEARRAGWPSRDAVLKQFARRTGDLYRIELHFAGPDPRAVLRDTAPTPELRERVERMGAWALEYLRAIAENPGVRAPELAERFGMETKPFKMRVRRLKELGLTESLPRGYRLSPRGEAFLRDSL